MIRSHYHFDNYSLIYKINSQSFKKIELSINDLKFILNGKIEKKQKIERVLEDVYLPHSF